MSVITGEQEDNVGLTDSSGFTVSSSHWFKCSSRLSLKTKTEQESEHNATHCRDGGVALCPADADSSLQLSVVSSATDYFSPELKQCVE